MPRKYPHRAPSKKRAKSSPPLTPYQVLELDNIIKNRRPPKELQSLKSAHSFTLPEQKRDFQLERVIHKVSLKNGMGAWRIDAKQKVIHGLPIQEIIRQKPGTEVQSPTLPLPPPEPPEWADLIYHPKILPKTMRSHIRRKNGKRLNPHGFIFGSDDRQTFFPSGYPWHCIGKLEVYNNPFSFRPSGVGTGALVGPNTVLTASHMVPWDANPAMISFTPGYFNGVSTAGNWVASFVDGATAYDMSADPAAAFDFAVLRLADRLGDSLGWLGVRSYDDDWNDLNVWTLVGYPGAVSSEQPSFQGGISFHDDDEDSNEYGEAMELETQNGDSSSGDSGGPYLAQWPDGPYIVGVDVGGEEEFVFNPFAPWPFIDQNNVASAGPALLQLCRWARENWD